jgi:FlaA1/EpsC-like NDP-sugar epimerase
MTINIVGIFNLAQASNENNATTFVLISIDKAVNPVNKIGATKRAAEIICQNMNNQEINHFITLPFGNVLDLAGG